GVVAILGFACTGRTCGARRSVPLPPRNQLGKRGHWAWLVAYRSAARLSSRSGCCTSASGFRSMTMPVLARRPNAFSVAAVILIILVGALLRLEYITEPFFDKFSWRESSTAMMAQNFYRGHWNILYPEVDWGGPGPNYQGREFQVVTYVAAVLYT